MVRLFFAWLPYAVVITGLSLMVYGVAQQEYRQGLDDPQIQMAEDAAAMLDRGLRLQNIVAYEGAQIDITTSLKPWLAILNADGSIVESDTDINGVSFRNGGVFVGSSGLLPSPPGPGSDGSFELQLDIPKGVLDHARSNSGKGTRMSHQNRVTWEPRPGVRQALVVVAAEDGRYAVAGRNMREVENRVAEMSEHVLIGWLVTLIGSFIGVYLARRFSSNRA